MVATSSLVACGSNDQQPETDSTTSVGDVAAEELGAHARRLYSGSYDQGEWPLTVAGGIVRCVRGTSVTFQPVDSPKKYAVNGTAKTFTKLPGIEPIWKKNPAVPGTRVNIAPVLDAGLKLC